MSGARKLNYSCIQLMQTKNPANRQSEFGTAEIRLLWGPGACGLYNFKKKKTCLVVNEEPGRRWSMTPRPQKGKRGPHKQLISKY